MATVEAPLSNSVVPPSAHAFGGAHLDPPIRHLAPDSAKTNSSYASKFSSLTSDDSNSSPSSPVSTYSSKPPLSPLVNDPPLAFNSPLANDQPIAQLEPHMVMTPADHDHLVASRSPVTLENDNLIIFDWDDTLLASTFLSNEGYRLDNDCLLAPAVSAQLNQLERCVITLLILAKRFGQVLIITNAEQGWVELSAQKFLPKVVPHLEGVQVFSARTTFESQFPEAPTQWKLQAFSHLLAVQQQQQQQSTSASSLSTALKNVISFGDSQAEREAVKATAGALEGSRTKSVKFVERPSIEQLRRQIELIINCFNYLIDHESDLDLMLTVSTPEQ
jgi:hypothetical protein